MNVYLKVARDRISRLRDRGFIHCSACGKECQVRIEDNSFGHEFGTEYIYDVISDCCEAEVE
jgi:transcription elongation factor Elf1